MDDIDSLLDAAKTNLSKQPAFTEDEDEDTVESISSNWKSLPKLDDDEGESQRQTIKNGVTSLDKPKEKKDGKLRVVNDPVQQKRDLKKLEESSAGDKWFNMPKAEITPEVKRDLQMIKMRGALDPKRHYKKDSSKPPTYFQQGTILEGNTEFFSARIPKKQREKSIADEILADSKSQQFFKRKYHEIQAQSMSGRRKHYKKVKQMRKKL